MEHNLEVSRSASTYANAVFRRYFDCIDLPETEVERLNYEAVKEALQGLSPRKVDLLRAVFVSNLRPLQAAVDQVSWDEQVSEQFVWKVVRNATGRFVKVRKL